MEDKIITAFLNEMAEERDPLYQTLKNDKERKTANLDMKVVIPEFIAWRAKELGYEREFKVFSEIAQEACIPALKHLLDSALNSGSWKYIGEKYFTCRRALKNGKPHEEWLKDYKKLKKRVKETCATK